MLKGGRMDSSKDIFNELLQNLIILKMLFSHFKISSHSEKYGLMGDIYNFAEDYIINILWKML